MTLYLYKIFCLEDMLYFSIATFIHMQALRKCSDITMSVNNIKFKMQICSFSNEKTFNTIFISTK